LIYNWKIASKFFDVASEIRTSDLLGCSIREFRRVEA
jgi:hypothetical protein